MSTALRALVLLVLVLGAESLHTAENIELGKQALHAPQLQANWPHAHRSEEPKFQEALLQARHMRDLPREALVQVQSEVKFEPVTICVITIMVLKLAVMLYQMARKWYKLSHAASDYATKLGMAQRDLDCKTMIDTYRASLVLDGNRKLLEQLAPQMFGDDWAKDDKASEAVDKCKEAMATARQVVDNEEQAARLNKFELDMFEDIDPQKYEETCTNTLDRLKKASKQVVDNVSQAKTRAKQMCGLSEANAPKCSDSSMFGSLEAQIRHECSISQARENYVDMMASSGSSPDPKSISVSPLTDFKVMDVVSTLVDGRFFIVAAGSLQKASESQGATVDPESSALQQHIDGGKQESHEAKMEAVPVNILVLTEFSLRVVDSLITAAITHFQYQKMKAELKDQLDRMCQLRLQEGLRVTELELLNHELESLYSAISVTARDSDWPLAEVMILRKLYAEYYGDQYFGTNVANKGWVWDRCEKFFEHFLARQFPKKSRRERRHRKWHQRCPQLMDTVATMVGLPTFEIWQVLFAPSSPGQSRMQRYQYVLFRKQRERLKEISERAPADMRSLGCPPFDPLQLQFQRERIFIETRDIDQAMRQVGDTRPICKAEDLAMCSLVFHYARCYPKPFHSKYGAGRVAKRHYQTFRTVFPWSSALPVGASGQDPYASILKEDCIRVENKMFEKLTNDADGWKDETKRTKLVTDMKALKLHVWDAPQEGEDGFDKVTPGTGNTVSYQATFGAKATWENNVHYALAYCGTYFQDECSHGTRLARWLAVPNGPFHREVVFGELRWYGAALFSKREWARDFTRETDEKHDFVPLGCADA